jgi:DNA-directed RNA polymerase subunit M/transcription elongation factor TFIIS
MACVECGKPTEWVVELQYKRANDPPSPFPCCPRCATHGQFRRRNMTTWRPARGHAA